MEALKKIFDTLGLKTETGLIILDDNQWIQKTVISSRIKQILNDKIKPQAIFCFGNKPLMLFFENPEDKISLHKQIWNLNECPIVIVVESGIVEIFNGFNYLNDENQSSLAKIGGQESLSDFSYFKLVAGKCWEKYQSEFSHKNRVDYQLLGNIKSARKKLCEKYGLVKQTANALVGKVIFIRYLIDRNVHLDISEYMPSWDNEGLCTLLSDSDRTKSFFDYLKTKFNSDDIFEITDDEYQSISNETLSVIVSLLRSEEISTGELSLFDLYDFSIIPVEFISNIYEQFIGQENQEKNGAYYTPQFLVEYILNEMITKEFNNSSRQSFKVLDPACGSGIFLVESLRRIVEHQGCNLDKELLKSLTTDNIYGVDKDKSAIQVAVFSIYLTLLDYQTPADIENFTFPKLIGCNIFQADFFDIENPFNKILANIKFDYIVGNPPWKRGKGGEKTTSLNHYLSQRKKKEEGSLVQITIGGEQIAQGFVLRTADFAGSNTRCALVINSKTLYNSNSSEFRHYFLSNNFLQKVFELAPVRKEVFNSEDAAIAPAAVLFFRNSLMADTAEQIVEHISLKKSRLFSLFKIFAIYRSDIKHVKQSLLVENDWLWKTLVYGSYLDFNFIKRLKNYQTINDKVIKDKAKIENGQGVIVNGKGKKKSSMDYIGAPFLDARKDVYNFWVNPQPQQTWTCKTALRPREPKLFEAPVLLINGGVNKMFENKIAFLRYNAIYSDSFVGVKCIVSQDEYLLYDIASMLSSTLFSYYGLHTFSYLGIERENTNDEEKWSLPFVSNDRLRTSIKRIEQLSKQKHEFSKLLNDDHLENEITNEKINLNNILAKVLLFSGPERSLIEYTTNILIPIQMGYKGSEKLLIPIEEHDPYIEDYAQLFIERFAKLFIKIGKHFYVRISCTKHIIAMFFCVRDETNAESIIWDDTDDNSLLNIAIQLSSEKVTENLFIQKDIRGFEDDKFYIIKPNEKRLWHRAVGYIDVEEFMDAILKSGRRL